MRSKQVPPIVIHTNRPALLALASQLLQMVLGIVVIPVVLNHLGSERFSLLATLFAMAFFTPLIDLGMSRTVARMSSSFRNDERGGVTVDHLRVAFRVQLVIVAVFIPLVILALRELVSEGRIGGDISTARSEVMTASVCFAVALGFQLIQNLFVAHMQGRGWLYRMAILISVSGIMTAATPLLLLIPSTNLSHIGIAYLLVRGVAMISAIAMVVRSERNLILERAPAQPVSARALAAEGMDGIVYFALTPFLVYGERYIAPFFSPGNNISSHLIAIDACLRLLVVPAILSQYSFRALTQGISRQGALRPIVDRYLSLMRMLFVLPITLIAIFTPELIALWLGSSVDQTVIICIRMALVAVSSCAISAFLVQIYIAKSMTLILSRLAVAEVLIYFSLIGVLLHFSLGWIQTALILTAVWSARVVAEGFVMAVLIPRDIGLPSFSTIWGAVMLYPIISIIIALVLEHSLSDAIQLPSKVAALVCLFALYVFSIKYDKSNVAN